MYSNLDKILQKIKRIYLLAIPEKIALKRLANSRRIIVLMYHDVLPDENIESWMVLKSKEFQTQMEYLKDNFRVVSINEAIAYMTDEISYDDNRPLAVITFDDGYVGNYSVALPILDSVGIPATIFVSTGAITDNKPYWYNRLIIALQGKMPFSVDLSKKSLGSYEINQTQGARNWSEIQRLLTDLKNLPPIEMAGMIDGLIDLIKSKPGSSQDQIGNFRPMKTEEVIALSRSPLITIGAHTHCHNILTQIPEADVSVSIDKSKKLLESWTDKPVKFFAYPNGDYNGAIISILKNDGFECAFTVKSRPWSSVDGSYTIPRIGIGRYDSFDLFKLKVTARV